jgi:hypothetical protein
MILVFICLLSKHIAMNPDSTVSPFVNTSPSDYKLGNPGNIISHAMKTRKRAVVMLAE